MRNGQQRLHQLHHEGILYNHDLSNHPQEYKYASNYENEDLPTLDVIDSIPQAYDTNNYLDLEPPPYAHENTDYTLHQNNKNKFTSSSSSSASSISPSRTLNHQNNKHNLPITNLDKNQDFISAQALEKKEAMYRSQAQEMKDNLQRMRERREMNEIRTDIEIETKTKRPLHPER